MEKPIKTLLISHAGIGDLASSLVMVDGLESLGHQVSALVRPEFVGFYAFRHIACFSEPPVGQSFDYIVDLTSSKVTRSIVRGIEARIKIGGYKSLKHRILQRFFYHHLFPIDPHIHIVKRMYPLLDYFGCPSFKLPQIPRQLPAQNGVVGLHLTASNPIRFFPKEQSLALLRYLSGLGYKVRVFGEEQDYINGLIRVSGVPAEYRRVALQDLVSELSFLEYFIGVDSGLLHTASALGVKSVGLLGPNTSAICGPINSNVIVLEKKLSCRPCSQCMEPKPPCPGEFQACFRKIELSDIAYALKRLDESEG